MDKLTEKLTKMRDAMKAGPSGLADVIAGMADELKELKSLVKEMLLKQEIANLKDLLADLKSTEKTSDSEKDPEYNTDGLPEQDLQEALAQLEGMTSIDVQDGVKHYLLHRPAANFEYENYADANDYETKQSTEWLAEVELAEALQVGKNPIMSCFIPESAIQSIQGQGGEVGAIAELKNPTSLEYRVVVKPGSYRIYRQIKAMS